MERINRSIRLTTIISVIIFVIASAAITATLIMEYYNQLLPLSLSMAAIILIIIVRVKRKNNYYGLRMMSNFNKYILLTISIIFLYLTFKFFKFDFNFFSIIVFYIPLLYSLVFPNPFFTVVIAILIIDLFSGYYPEVGRYQLHGYSVGVFTASLLYACLAYLIDYLFKEKERFRNLSIKDSLTDAYNLDYILKAGEEILADKKKLGIYLLDINHFKQFNDTYGHLVGNQILIQLANFLKKELVDYTSLVGRLGGDEFVILIEDISLKESKHILNRLISDLKNKSFEGDKDLSQFNISVSVGLAHCKEGNTYNIQELLNHADERMYFHKHHNFSLGTKISSKDYLSK